MGVRIRSGRRRAAALVRPRWVRWWMVAGAGVLALTLGWSLRYLVFPQSDVPGPTDAVVLLAGAPETRLPVALGLATTGPGLLVVSAAGGQVNEPARALCDTPPRDVVVLCFEPERPQSTRTEARAIGDLVEERGWTRVTVVTSSYHMERARLLLGRCTDADLRLIEARPNISGPRWAFSVLGEFRGLAVAALDRSC